MPFNFGTAQQTLHAKHRKRVLAFYVGHYSTFFGATVLREVLDICPYSSLLVGATKKWGIMAICWASLSRISNIHSKLEKKPREKHLVASPPRVFHSVFSLVCLWILVNTASRITAYCPNIFVSGCRPLRRLPGPRQFHQRADGIHRLWWHHPHPAAWDPRPPSLRARERRRQPRWQWRRRTIFGGLFRRWR